MAASKTNAPQTRPPAGVATLDWELTAVRENEPVTGQDITKADNAFADPIAN